ncbi:hypothetical protein L195_g050918 [Trifolium pratense]|uniref:Myb/SANT-like domain-containing protein n=1 Tax=Trifolium pratense TaxID=57577 RepID=A0A2K3JWQ5_TRIPR|nr:hypothetical protein L195_g050918 [Trifolium pratense]
MCMTTDDNVTEVQDTNQYHQGTDITTEKGKSVTWTDEMDLCLTELLVKQVMLGNKLEKNFKTSAYIATLAVLNDRFDLNLTIENIKSRLRTWRKHYVLMKQYVLMKESRLYFVWFSCFQLQPQPHSVHLCPNHCSIVYLLGHTRTKHRDARRLRDKRIEKP